MNTPRPTKTTAQIAAWALNGETGLSSECMARVALGYKPHRHDRDWPHDPADLNRCLKLVKEVPGVRRHFPKIRALNKQWRAVIDHWSELHDMFVAEVGWDWEQRDKCATETYQRMKALGL